MQTYVVWRPVPTSVGGYTTSSSSSTTTPSSGSTNKTTAAIATASGASSHPQCEHQPPARYNDLVAL